MPRKPSGKPFDFSIAKTICSCASSCKDHRSRLELVGKLASHSKLVREHMQVRTQAREHILVPVLDTARVLELHSKSVPAEGKLELEPDSTQVLELVLGSMLELELGTLAPELGSMLELALGSMMAGSSRP